MNNFADEVRSVLSDATNLPDDFLNYLVQWNAMNPVKARQGSSLALIAYGTHTANVTATGTTFATGTALFNGIEFTDTGSGNYLLSVRALSWTNDTANKTNFLSVSLDGAEAGKMGSSGFTSPTFSMNCSFDGFFQAAPGNHTVKPVFWVNGGTGTIFGDVGGAGKAVPILGALYRLS